jgi:hypothetical protein
MVGAWDSPAIIRANLSIPRDSPDLANAVKTMLAKEILSLAQVVRKERALTIDLEQTCPGWPCGEQGMDLQHCIACSGVHIASQSKEYTASTAIIVTTRVCSARDTRQT